MAVPAFIAKLGEAMAKLSDRVLEFVSAEKAVDSINKQIDPQMEVYRQMMAEISIAEDIPTEKKVELLNQIADDIDVQQYHANEKLEKRQKDASEVAIKVIAAVFTAGISLTPDLIRRFKAMNPQIEAARIDRLIEDQDASELQVERGSAESPEEEGRLKAADDDVIDADFVECGPDWTYIDFGDEESPDPEKDESEMFGEAPEG